MRSGVGQSAKNSYTAEWVASGSCPTTVIIYVNSDGPTGFQNASPEKPWDGEVQNGLPHLWVLSPVSHS